MSHARPGEPLERVVDHAVVEALPGLEAFAGVGLAPHIDLVDRRQKPGLRLAEALQDRRGICADRRWRRGRACRLAVGAESQQPGAHVFNGICQSAGSPLGDGMHDRSLEHRRSECDDDHLHAVRKRLPQHRAAWLDVAQVTASLVGPRTIAQPE